MRLVLFFKCRACGSNEMVVQIDLQNRVQNEECLTCGEVWIFDATISERVDGL